MTTATNDNASPRSSEALPRDDLHEMLLKMMVIRRFEQRTAQSYQQAKIGGFCHLYIGQEAIAVGSITALRPDDPVITAYRDHGHALARGMAPTVAMAEMFGCLTGCSKGKGGSMHLFDKDHHLFGGHAIVGGQLPLAVGLAFAVQYLGQDKVVVCYFGDGALNSGAFHESMNLAALWKLPIIMTCENNGYSMGTSIARGTAMGHDLSKKAQGYDMRFAHCDGMDVLAVYDCFRREATSIRSGAGPVLVDAHTYRYKGHSMSDPQKYRSPDEVEQYEQQDPIDRLADPLMETDQATQQQIDELHRRAKATALDAIEYAAEAPPAPLEQLYTDVYAQPYGRYQQAELS